MRPHSSIILMLLFIGSMRAAPSAGSTSAEERIDAIEKSIVSSRERIRRGELTISSLTRHNSLTKSGGSHPIEVEYARRLIFDGTSLRADTEVKRALSTGPFKEVSCFHDSTNIWFTGSGPANMMANITDTKKNKVSLREEIPSPLIIGLVPAEYAASVYNDYRTEFAWTNRTDFAVQDAKYRGADCVKVEYSRATGVKRLYYVDINKDYNILYHEISYKVDGHDLVFSIENTLSRVERGAIWFPSSCHFRHSSDGKVISEEVLSVDVVQLNEPVDKSQFELASLGMPAGTGLQRIPPNLADNRLEIWDGKAIIKKQHQSAKPEDSHSNKLYLSLFVNSIAVMIIVCIVMIRTVRKARRRASSDGAESAN